MSWIHINDLINIFLFLIDGKGSHPVYNATAPLAVTNMEFTKQLSNHLNRPAFFPAPSFSLKMLLGEKSTLLLSGQKVVPENLLENQYQFEFETLDQALSKLI